MAPTYNTNNTTPTATEKGGLSVAWTLLMRCTRPLFIHATAFTRGYDGAGSGGGNGGGGRVLAQVEAEVCGALATPAARVHGPDPHSLF